MKSLILAAGRGSRIPRISKTKPKCLIKINGKSILGRQIYLMRKNNIAKIAVVRGFKKNKIKFKKIKYFYNRNYKKNEQLDSLMTAKKFFNSDIIVTFSDIIYDEKILNILIQNKFYKTELNKSESLRLRIKDLVKECDDITKIKSIYVKLVDEGGIYGQL